MATKKKAARPAARKGGKPTVVKAAQAAKPTRAARAAKPVEAAKPAKKSARQTASKPVKKAGSRAVASPARKAPAKPVRKAAARGAGRPAGRKTTRKVRPAPARPAGLSLIDASPGFTANDLERSRVFYRDVLGFTEGQRWERDGVLAGLELVAGKVTLMIGQDDWKKGRDRKKGEGFRIYLTTDQDVDALAARVKGHGVELEQEPGDRPWGMRDFSLVDPDGFKLTIGATLKKA